jgi:hypothetical protein
MKIPGQLSAEINSTYIITTKPITSGEELKRRKGLGGRARDLRDISPLYRALSMPATLL